MGRPKKRPEPAVLKSLRDKRILFVDDYLPILSSYKMRLAEAGFASVDTAGSSRKAWKLFDKQHPDVLLIDIHLGEYERDGLDLLTAFGVQGFKGLAAVVSGDQAVRQVYRGLAAGADDYWVKGPYLNPVVEVVDLLTRPAPLGEMKWDPENMARLGFWRTIGATDFEVDSVVEYSRRFRTYEELAGDLRRSPDQLRKTMSKVKAKCGVKTLTEFGQLLTLCEMMGSRPRQTAS